MEDSSRCIIMSRQGGKGVERDIDQRPGGGRYLLAEAGDALVVTFMGTKQRRDLLTNANVILEPVWPADVAAGAPPVLVPPRESAPCSPARSRCCRPSTRQSLTASGAAGLPALHTTPGCSVKGRSARGAACSARGMMACSAWGQRAAALRARR